MSDFLQCVAEAVAEQGVKGLAGMVPGGPFAYAVAESAARKYRQRRTDARLRADLLAVAAASGEQAAAAARSALAGKGATADEAAGLELFLAAIPGTVRRSRRRPADLAPDTAAGVLQLLPPRPPRFRPADPLPGKPGWALEQLLGVGGFGEVWLARHPRLASLTGAVKFCLGDTGRELVHEAALIDRVMTAGRHPGIVPLTDCNLDGDAPWLMFEFVPGGGLTDWVHTLVAKPPAERVRLAWLAVGQLAGAVAHFHALTPPVVHRDLKPSNILLDRATGRLRVTDFGIGAVTAREVLPAGLRAAHTPVYASPQQRRGADPDPRDDVHALGVIGYQLLTGDLTGAVGPDFADDLREAGADDARIAVLGRCVSGKAERRPADAGELGRLLAAPARVRPARSDGACAVEITHAPGRVPPPAPAAVAIDGAECVGKLRRGESTLLRLPPGRHRLAVGPAGGWKQHELRVDLPPDSAAVFYVRFKESRGYYLEFE